MNLRTLGLTAILAGTTFLNSCERKNDFPVNQPITIEEIVKNPNFKDVDFGVAEAIELDTVDIPAYVLKQRLVEKEELTRNEFYKLKSLTEKPEDIKFILEKRNIKYPDKDSEDYKKALEIDYGAPLDTLNHKNPAVCDEFAILHASILYGMKGVEDVYILSFCNTNDKEEINSCHAISMYRTKEGWNFTSNTTVYQVDLPTFEDCLAKAMEETRYLKESVKKINILKIESYSDWVYDSNISRQYLRFNMNDFNNPLILPTEEKK
ncbi:MAG: hypothetical protein Q8Q01_05770 [archaeon]|nr:hypothetical protein [archaeon]